MSIEAVSPLQTPLGYYEGEFALDVTRQAMQALERHGGEGDEARLAMDGLQAMWQYGVVERTFRGDLHIMPYGEYLYLAHEQALADRALAQDTVPYEADTSATPVVAADLKSAEAGEEAHVAEAVKLVEEGHTDTAELLKGDAIEEEYYARRGDITRYNADSWRMLEAGPPVLPCSVLPNLAAALALQECDLRAEEAAPQRNLAAIRADLTVSRMAQRWVGQALGTVTPQPIAAGIAER